jgi:HlyD family secretion protein
MTDTSFRDTRGQDTRISNQNQRRASWRKIAIVLGLLIALALLASPVLRYLSGDAIRSASLRFATVSRGDLVREAAGFGRVVAARSPSLYAANAGVVRFVAEAGTRVEAGALLAEIDSPELKSRLAQEQSTLLGLRSDAARQKVGNQRAAFAKAREVDSARIAKTAALREWQRAERAFALNAISAVDHLRAKDALDAAEILLAAAERDLSLEHQSLRLELDNRQAQVTRQIAAVAELERQVAALKITAPFAGAVGQLLVPDRSSVAANTALLSVVDLEQLELEVSVGEIYSADLAVGLNAAVEYAGNMLPATVRLVSPEIQNGALSVRVKFAEPQPSDLRQNQRMNVRIRFDERKDVLVVDRGAFLDSDGGRIAWKRVGNNLSRVPIETGGFSTEKIEIRSGLNVNDVIVSSALPRVVSGDQIVLID